MATLVATAATSFGEVELLRAWGGGPTEHDLVLRQGVIWSAWAILILPLSSLAGAIMRRVPGWPMGLACHLPIAALVASLFLVLENSLTAAQAYEAEHRHTLNQDAISLASFIELQRNNIPLINDALLRDILTRGQTAMQHALQEAFIIDGIAELVVRGENSYKFDFEPPSPEEISRALTGEIVIIEDWPNSEYRALLALTGFPDRYLYVTRDVDGEI